MNDSPIDTMVDLPLRPARLDGQDRDQIDLQIATAKRYPRVLSRVKTDMLEFATLDEETASSCFYTLQRAGKTIRGPSVRLAEIAFSSWTNLRAGTRIVELVAEGPSPHVTVQAMAFDLERNISVVMEKRRRIFTKRGKQAPDEDDVNLAHNAASAFGFRDAVFKVIPKTIIGPVVAAAMRVAVGDVKSLAAKRASVVGRLKQMGLTEDRILAVVNAGKVDDIGLEQLATLIGLGTALKDGETTLEEAFPVLPPKPGAPPGQEAKGPPPPGAPPPPVDKDSRPQGGDLSHETPPTSGAPPAAEAGPIPNQEQTELVEWMAENSISFSSLQEWIVANRWDSDWDSYASILQVPSRSVRKILKSKAILLKQIQAQR